MRPSNTARRHACNRKPPEEEMASETAEVVLCLLTCRAEP